MQIAQKLRKDLKKINDSMCMEIRDLKEIRHEARLDKTLMFSERGIKDAISIKETKRRRESFE